MKKLIVLLFGIVLFFVGCEHKQNTQDTNKTVNVGLLLPLTGNGALYGKYVKDGAELALSEINSTKYKIIIEDTKTTAKDGVTSANKLILENNIPILVGPMSSTVAKAVGNICQKKKVLMITTASAPSIASIGDYIYRIYPSDSFDGKFLAEQIVKQNLLKSVIIYLNNDFGQGMVNVFEKKYNNLNGTVIDKLSFSPNQQDFSTLISKLKNLKFDNVLIIATQKEYINILNKMESLNIINVPIFAPVNIEDKIVVDSISKRMLQNIQYSKPVFDLDNNLNEVQKKFKKMWFEKHKEDPNIFNAYGYDLVHLVHNIISNTENTRYEDTLNSLGNIIGATGTYKFDKNGDVVRSFSLLKLKDL